LTNSTTNEEEFGNYVSQAEAARIIGTTKQTVANLVRQGHFTTQKAAGQIFLPRSEVDLFVARRKGRPSNELQAEAKYIKRQPANFDRPDLEEYVSQAEAARIRGISQQAIANLIRRGRLAPVSLGGRTLVHRSEVEAFVARPKLGRPHKKTGKKKARQKSRPKK
jgi:excisionase family DNA binding protein